MIYLAVEVKVDSQDVEKHLNQGEKYTRTSVDDMEVIYESTGRGAPIIEEWVSNHQRYIWCQLAAHVFFDFALPLCRRNPPDMAGRPVAARQSWLAGDKSAYLASFFCIILPGTPVHCIFLEFIYCGILDYYIVAFWLILCHSLITYCHGCCITAEATPGNPEGFMKNKGSRVSPM